MPRKRKVSKDNTPTTNDTPTPDGIDYGLAYSTLIREHLRIVKEQREREAGEQPSPLAQVYLKLLMWGEAHDRAQEQDNTE